MSVKRVSDQPACTRLYRCAIETRSFIKTKLLSCKYILLYSLRLIFLYILSLGSLFATHTCTEKKKLGIKIPTTVFVIFQEYRNVYTYGLNGPRWFGQMRMLYVYESHSACLSVCLPLWLPVCLLARLLGCLLPACLSTCFSITRVLVCGILNTLVRCSWVITQ